LRKGSKKSGRRISKNQDEEFHKIEERDVDDFFFRKEIIKLGQLPYIPQQTKRSAIAKQIANQKRQYMKDKER
jgi:hypothetical protein